MLANTKEMEKVLIDRLFHDYLTNCLDTMLECAFLPICLCFVSVFDVCVLFLFFSLDLNKCIGKVCKICLLYFNMTVLQHRHQIPLAAVAICLLYVTYKLVESNTSLWTSHGRPCIMEYRLCIVPSSHSSSSY